jgi:hypothetical protein
MKPVNMSFSIANLLSGSGVDFHVHVDNDSSDHDLHELVRINSKVFSSHSMFLFPP